MYGLHHFQDTVTRTMDFESMIVNLFYLGEACEVPNLDRTSQKTLDFLMGVVSRTLGSPHLTLDCNEHSLDWRVGER